MVAASLSAHRAPAFGGFGVALLACVAPSSVTDDGRELLAKAKQSALALSRLHAVVRVVDTADDGSETQRAIECWIDVKSGRARTEVRSIKKALPDYVVCGGPDLLQFERLEVDEVAEQRGQYDLPTLLAASFAGELLATTFRGDLVSMKAAAYQTPTIATGEEKVAGEACTRLHFSGNDEADLWIATRDHLPRRLKGRVSGRVLDETITQLDSDFVIKAGNAGEMDDFAGVSLEIKLVEGRHPLAIADAMKRWGALPPESSRWLAIGDAAPDFAALDLTGATRMLSETADENALLAFWNAEDDDSVAKAARVEQAYREHGDPAVHFIHVAALAERDPVADATARHHLAQPVWVAGCHEKNAFRRFHIWTAPVFVRIDDMKIVAITHDADEARHWFKSR